MSERPSAESQVAPGSRVAAGSWSCRGLSTSSRWSRSARPPGQDASEAKAEAKPAGARAWSRLPRIRRLETPSLRQKTDSTLQLLRISPMKKKNLCRPAANNPGEAPEWNLMYRCHGNCCSNGGQQRGTKKRGKKFGRLSSGKLHKASCSVQDAQFLRRSSLLPYLLVSRYRLSTHAPLLGTVFPNPQAQHTQRTQHTQHAQHTQHKQHTHTQHTQETHTHTQHKRTHCRTLAKGKGHEKQSNQSSFSAMRPVPRCLVW